MGGSARREAFKKKKAAGSRRGIAHTTTRKVRRLSRVGTAVDVVPQMSDSSSSDGEDAWIQWFCGLPGHEMFCEVQRGYIEDGFNLYGLRHLVPRINDCLDVILDRVCEYGGVLLCIGSRANWNGTSRGPIRHTPATSGHSPETLSPG